MIGGCRKLAAASCHLLEECCKGISHRVGWGELEGGAGCEQVI